MAKFEMVAVNGVCQYCGQNRVVMKPPGKAYTEDELNRIATMECECPGAEAESIVNKRANDAKGAIEMVLAKKNKKTAAQILLAAVDAVARDRVKKVSVNVDGETICSMYSKGKKIIVESRRTEVEYSDGEAEE